MRQNTASAGIRSFEESIGKYVLWLLMAEMFVMCVTIIIIDLLVKNLFDENGVRVR